MICTVEMSVRAPTIATVAQAMTLNAGLFVQLPMSRLLLMSKSMSTSTIGKSTPLSTCE